MQVLVKPHSLAESMLSDRHRRSYARSAGHLDEPWVRPVGGPRWLGIELSIVMKIGSKNLRYGRNHLAVENWLR
jgi:hypothetical protein